MTTPDHDPPAEEPNRDGKRFEARDFDSSRALRDKLLGLGREKPLPDDPPTTKQKQEAAKRVGDGEFALSLVEDDLIPFQSEGEADAVLSDRGRSRIIALRSREFGALIRRRFRAETNRLLGKAAFGAALQALIDKALEREEKVLHLRTAPIPERHLPRSRRPHAAGGNDHAHWLRGHGYAARAVPRLVGCAGRAGRCR